jgi:uncharacterized membrane protein YdfJ with MMPL/SSD domain
MLKVSFQEIRSAMSSALLHIAEIGALVDLWMPSNSGVNTKHQIGLAVDAVAFRPTATVCEDGQR